MAKYRISEYHYVFLKQSASRVDQIRLRECTINNNLLTESITFSVDGYNYEANPKRFTDAKDYIGRQVVRQVLVPKITEKKLRAMGFQFWNMFSADGNDLSDSDNFYSNAGVLNVYIGQFLDLTREIVDNIRKTISETSNIKLNGDIKTEQSKSRDSVVVRVPIVVTEPEDDAPEMNLSNHNAAELFNLLGIPFEDYSGKYSVQMLLGQIAVTRSKLEGLAMPDKSYMQQLNKPKPAKFGVGELGNKEDVRNVKKLSFPAPSLNETEYGNVMGKDQLMRYLDKLEKMCRWAVDHGYIEISFG